jgi:hypothetical protein
MDDRRLARVACSFAAAILPLCGCGAPGPSGAGGALPATGTELVAPGATHRSWISPAAKSAKQLLYVGDPNAGFIDIFSLHHLKYTLIGQIGDLNSPQGMTTDAAGNLYVADIGVATEGPVPGDIAVYHQGGVLPFRFIVPASWTPFDLAVGRNGTIYSANIAPIASFTPGSVSVFKTNSDQPVRVLHLKNFQVDGIALHARSNTIYITYDTGQTGRIASFTHARGKAKDLGVSFASPWGLMEDGTGNLLACSGPGQIYVYAEATGEIKQTIDVPNATMFEAFNHQRSLIFVSNFEQVEIVSYPGGNVVGSVTQPGWSKTSWPTGVAIWPPP